MFIIERAYGKAFEKTQQVGNPLEDATTDLLLEMRENLQWQIETRKQVGYIETQDGASPTWINPSEMHIIGRAGRTYDEGKHSFA